ncbi:flippase-like domain-containing protein [Microcoleus sp. FACHB-1515]|uniref:lysylphosphatidylglycerol synthase transmembrane domain-containing protein n=1 Tax=Cyanophyceae TaxID=3028117 RepID=UPI0016820075|nr:lysylphosphatidylglycerol synthase transmembrane domain-containing protein [Microcoleus sp. FACHB-1515]MBD2090324.1 flippase-like domain-containing protein [Microcoleus sp. FACHB-1515]
MKRFLSLIVSLAILAVIYWRIDVQGLARAFANGDRFWLLISLGMVIPLTGLTAWRLQILSPGRLAWGESNRLILAACTLNMVLPSKMGDIAKAYFMRDRVAQRERNRANLDGAQSLSLVVFEKACDLLSLLFWCAIGLLIYPRRDWLFALMTFAVVGGLAIGLGAIASRRIALSAFQLARQIVSGKKLDKLQTAWDAMHNHFWRDRLRLWRVASLSVFIWFLHLLQIWFFILALNAWTPFLANLALAPLAILAGLLPLTFAGVGTRDAALILFYQPYFNPATAAALGLLCTSRYLLPAIAGLPFLGNYLSLIRREKHT